MSGNSKSGIVLADIHKSLGEPPTKVLQGISLEIPRGEFISLVGRSGSGKSTLLYVASTLDPPSSGRVQYDGIDIAKLSQPDLHSLRNLTMGFVFQFHYLLPELSAVENVLMPAMKSGRHKELRPRAEELLREVGLEGKFDRLPRQLSGGEQQRTAIARALIQSPAYLFADEPTGALDSVNGTRVMDLFERINREFGTTIVLVTHDNEYAKRAHRIVRLKDGEVIEDARTPARS